MKYFPFLEVLTLIFVIAKIFGFVNWSWWLVFMPVLIQLGLGIIILLGIGFYTFLK